MMVAVSPAIALAQSPEEFAIWEKIRCFPFDSGDGPHTFAIRLAREQSWSASFTTLAIGEYRRFLLLFALEQRRQKDVPTEPGHRPGVQFVPSPAVDAVWHLHLLYTKSYWDVLCHDILNAPLHHLPADASAGEAASLDQAYRGTLAAYQSTFGSPPPASVWPSPGPRKRRSLPVHLAVFFGRRLATASASTWSGFAVLAVALLWSWFAPEGSPARQLIPLVLGCGVVIVALTAIFAAISPRSSKRRGKLQDEGVDSWSYLGGSCGAGSPDGSPHQGGDHGGTAGHSCGGGGHSCGGHGCGGHGCGGH
jgi:hypothetical protein